MTNETLVYCYNKGCKHKKFDPKNNPPDSVECVYHPGVPIFHDAMKIWSCCNKKSHDFTEFLDIKGCAKGPHNPVKPPEPVKPTPVIDEKQIAEPMGQPVMKAAVRESPQTLESRLLDLPITITPALRESLAKMAAEAAIAKNDSTETSDSPKVIEKGAPCKNRGCTKSYEPEDEDGVDSVQVMQEEDDEDKNHQPKPQRSARSKCVYHPGVPVFHEGMKFWSCCQRKTADFDVFLNQEGCEEGEHNWLQKGERIVKQNSCRSDHHQTSNLLTLNYYAKLCDPARSRIRASGTELDIHLEYDGGNSVYDRRLQLFGAIDPSKSCVKIGAKVELLLAKLDKLAWPRLEFTPPQPVVVQESTED